MLVRALLAERLDAKSFCKVQEMSRPEEHVIVVHDPDFGEKADKLAEILPVWLSYSPSNRAVAEKFWATHDPGALQLTIFDIDESKSAEENFS